jgi:hypothetical protein
MTSPWCFFEIAEAKALNKDLFPLKIAPCEVVDILKERQVIDVTEEGEEEAYGRLSLASVPRGSTRTTVSPGTRPGHRRSPGSGRSRRRMPASTSAGTPKCMKSSES